MVYKSWLVQAEGAEVGGGSCCSGQGCRAGMLCAARSHAGAAPGCSLQEGPLRTVMFPILLLVTAEEGCPSALVPGGCWAFTCLTEE